MAAAVKVKGAPVRIIAQGGDGATVDIGFGCLSGMFERNDDVLYLCYDNEAYMNTGVQRSGSTPALATTATTQAVGSEPGNRFGVGKCLPKIAMAHGIPYVATASVADLHDLERKIIKSMTFRGARYMHIHVPCPLGWGSDPADTIRLARLAVESGLFPLFEAEHGKITARRTIRQRVPVEEYLKRQKRFAHLFGPQGNPELVARIQEIADRNIEEFKLDQTRDLEGVLRL
jgi:pyruvate ferredoxin oxidoreductase beta subunit